MQAPKLWDEALQPWVEEPYQLRNLWALASAKVPKLLVKVLQPLAVEL